MSELPFLKRKNQGGGGPPIIKRVSADGLDHKELIGHAADEFMTAIEKKDLKAFHEALQALVLMISDKDDDNG